MGILRGIFGPSKDEIWQRLSTEIGAEFTAGGFWKGSKVQAHVQHWTVTLDTCTEGEDTYTRLRAPYVNKDGFRFTIYRKVMLVSGLAKLLGMQDVEVGYPDFDRDFIIKGNDEAKVRALFADHGIRTLIQAQPSIHFGVRDDEGWFQASFPEGVDELYFAIMGTIKDLDRLKSLFDLFAAVLNRLCHIGSAYEDDPHIQL